MSKSVDTTSQPDMFALLVAMLPKGLRDDLGKVYRFCVLARECATSSQVDGVSLKELTSTWKKAKKTLGSGTMHESDTDIDVAVRGMAYIVHRYQCDPVLVDTYLAALAEDTSLAEYGTLDDQLLALEGLAETIACICAKVVGIRDTHSVAVRAQARAFAQLSYIRSCGEDNLNGRLRIPRDELVMFGLKQLDEKEAAKKPAEFREFIQYQVARYSMWQQESRELLRHVPLQVRMTLNTARDAHDWIAHQILENPQVVFEQKVFPRRLRFAYMKVSRKFVF